MDAKWSSKTAILQYFFYRIGFQQQVTTYETNSSNKELIIKYRGNEQKQKRQNKLTRPTPYKSMKYADPPLSQAQNYMTQPL